MFWGKKKKSAKKPAKQAVKNADHKQSIEEIRAQAMANAKAARENLGEETIDRIAELMKQKQNSTMERMKAEIVRHDKDKIASELLFILREEN